jgi:hypothetical protein
MHFLTYARQYLRGSRFVTPFLVKLGSTLAVAVVAVLQFKNRLYEEPILTLYLYIYKYIYKYRSILGFWE